MTEQHQIEGFGGGSKEGGESTIRAAVEDPNSLVSHQYANVIDLISEGPIQGLVDGLKSVYLNGVPVQNASGTYNFQGVTLDTTLGTQSQGILPSANWAGSEVGVATEVIYGVPVTRHINASGQTRLRVTIEIPSLTYLNPSTGDLHGHSVRILVAVNNNGGGYVTVVDDTIKGKCVSKYQRAYMINLPANGPWDVKVTRVSPDDPTSNYSSNTWWVSYTEITDDKFNYPNSALAAVTVDSQYFSNIPTRGYHIKGLQVKVPTNYDPLTRGYGGTWDGTFKIAWTDNPAWCFYDMLTNDRYGLGKYITAEQVDKWTLYSIAQYCDVLVDDGFGGTEPRFTCNLYLQSQEEAYNVIANIASIFRALVYWSNGQIIPVQDAPANPVALYSPANIVGGQFVYEGSSIKTRHTVALVTWNDPTDNYRQKVEYVPLRSAVKQFGFKETSVTAFGCTSRGQAHRLGLWMLMAEQNNRETISFRVGLDGILSPPGGIIQTNDPSRQTKRLGGRIISATTTAITLDFGVDILSDKTYTLSCVLPSGIVETRDVTNLPGTNIILINLASALSDIPQAMAMWSLEQNDTQGETWRVIHIQEAEDASFEITALSHDANLYTSVDTDAYLSALPTIPPIISVKPTEVTFKESIYPASFNTVGVSLNVSWKGNSQNYIVQYREQDGNWETIPTTQNNVDIQGVVTGMTYDFIIVAIDVTGFRLATDIVQHLIAGINLTPPQVTGLAIQGDGEGSDVTIAWLESVRTDSYSIEVRTAGILRRTVNTTNLVYTYTDQDQKEDGTSARAVNFRVWSVNNSGRSTLYAEVTGGNTAPAQLTGVNTLGNEAAFVIYYNPPAERDWAGVLVHLGTSPVTPSLANLVYDGKDGSIVIARDALGAELVIGTTYYYQIAAYDTYGKVIADLNYLTTSGVITLVGTTGGVPVVTSLPVTPAANQEVVLLTTDRKLYRWNGSAYIKTTDGADILANSITADKITVANLAAIQANLGTVLAGTIINDSVGHIRGGQSAFGTGNGYWLGWDTTDSKYKFSLGNEADDKMTFDQGGLKISGRMQVIAHADEIVSGLNGTFDNLTDWYDDNSDPVTDANLSIVVDQGDNRLQYSGATMSRIFQKKFAVNEGETFKVSIDYRGGMDFLITQVTLYAIFSITPSYSHEAVTYSLTSGEVPLDFTNPLYITGILFDGNGGMDSRSYHTIEGSFLVPSGAVWCSILLEINETL